MFKTLELPGGFTPLAPLHGLCPGPTGGLKRPPDPSPNNFAPPFLIPGYGPVPTCVYTSIHVVNYCTAKSYVNDNTWSRTCALIPLCSSCDFYVNWKDFSMPGKQ